VEDGPTSFEAEGIEFTIDPNLLGVQLHMKKTKTRPRGQ